MSKKNHKMIAKLFEYYHNWLSVLGPQLDRKEREASIRTKKAFTKKGNEMTGIGQKKEAKAKSGAKYPIPP